MMNYIKSDSRMTSFSRPMMAANANVVTKVVMEEMLSSMCGSPKPNSSSADDCNEEKVHGKVPLIDIGSAQNAWKAVQNDWKLASDEDVAHFLLAWYTETKDHLLEPPILSVVPTAPEDDSAVKIKAIVAPMDEKPKRRGRGRPSRKMLLSKRDVDATAQHSDYLAEKIGGSRKRKTTRGRRVSPRLTTRVQSPPALCIAEDFVNTDAVQIKEECVESGDVAENCGTPPTHIDKPQKLCDNILIRHGESIPELDLKEEEPVASENLEFYPKVQRKLIKSGKRRRAYRKSGKVARKAKSFSTKVRTKKHRCCYCDEVFTNRTHMLKHTLSEHSGDNEAAFLCRMCVLVFKNKEDLLEHRTVEHDDKMAAKRLARRLAGKKSSPKKNAEKKPAPEKRFIPESMEPVSCGVCKTTFKNSIHRNEHERKEHTEYFCSICGKGFGSQWKAFDVHRKRVHVEEDCLCNICGKMYSKPVSLKHHIAKKHEGKLLCKIVSCPICGKQFKGKSAMWRHHRTHTKEKPYICDYCGKAFSQDENLRVHIRIHTGERPYNCQYCDRSFTTKQWCQNHENTHVKNTDSANKATASVSCNGTKLGRPSKTKIHTPIATSGMPPLQHMAANFSLNTDSEPSLRYSTTPISPASTPSTPNQLLPPTTTAPYAWHLPTHTYNDPASALHQYAETAFPPITPSRFFQLS